MFYSINITIDLSYCFVLLLEKLNIKGKEDYIPTLFFQHVALSKQLWFFDISNNIFDTEGTFQNVIKVVWAFNTFTKHFLSREKLMNQRQSHVTDLGHRT